MELIRTLANLAAGCPKRPRPVTTLDHLITVDELGASSDEEAEGSVAERVGVNSAA